MTISNLSQIQPQNLWAELTQLGNSSGTSSSSSATLPQDPTPQLSTASQFLSNLQNLQTTNPGQFKQVTQGLATELQNMAQAATSAGNTSAAGALTRLASDFQTASQTGQMPSTEQLQTDASGLASSTQGAHHGHHHHHSYSGQGESSSSTSSSTSTDPLSALFGSLASQSQTSGATGVSSLLGSIL